MRGPYSFGAPPTESAEAFIRWASEALRQIEQSSHDQIDKLAAEYTITGTLTETRVIDVDTPSVANVAAVLATFLTDLKRGGSRRRRGG